MHQPYPTYNRRSLLYADMDRCLTGLYHLGDPGDNRESLSFYRRIIEAGIETQLTPDERQIIELRYRRGLPAAEAETAVAYGKQQLRPEERRFYMGVAVFFRMRKGRRAESFGELGNQQAEKTDHVAPDIRVRPFVDGQTAGRMRAEQQQSPVTTLPLVSPARNKAADLRRNIT